MSFGDLRSLLHQPSPDTWPLLCRHLEGLPQDATAHTLSYCDSLLSDWPDAWRTCPSRWARRYLRGESPPWLSLIRSLQVPLVPDLQTSIRWLRALLEDPQLQELRALNLSLLSLGRPAADILHQHTRLPHLEHLKLAGNELGTQGAIDLAGAPWLSRLRELDLYNNEMELLGVAALLDADWPHLEHLRLAANPLRKLVPLLLSGEQAPNLHTLDLNGCQLEHLLLDLPSLTHLSLDRNPLGDAGLRSLCQHPPPRLEDLRLGENYISGEGEGVTPIPTLRHLGLWKNRLGEGGLEALRRRGLFESLDSLSLSDNQLDARSLALGLPERLVDLDVTWNPVGDTLSGALDDLLGLRSLRASHCGLSDVGARALLHHPNLEGLETLDLAGHHLGPDIAGALGALGLRELHMRNNRLGPRGAHALAGAPALSKLHTLDLTNNDIGPQGAQALARSPHLSNLRVLHLRANAIGDAGLLALLESPYLRELRALYLSENDIGDAGALRLAQSTHFDRLRILHLNRNPIGAESVALLRQAPHLLHLQTLWLSRP